jgi:hypothetical protein
MDRVFVYGDVYMSKQRFENGRFVGKRAELRLDCAIRSPPRSLRA